MVRIEFTRANRLKARAKWFEDIIKSDQVSHEAKYAMLYSLDAEELQDVIIGIKPAATMTDAVNPVKWWENLSLHVQQAVKNFPRLRDEPIYPRRILAIKPHENAENFMLVNYPRLREVVQRNPDVFDKAGKLPPNHLSEPQKVTSFIQKAFELEGNLSWGLLLGFERKAAEQYSGVFDDSLADLIRKRMALPEELYALQKEAGRSLKSSRRVRRRTAFVPRLDILFEARLPEIVESARQAGISATESKARELWPNVRKYFTHFTTRRVGGLTYFNVGLGPSSQIAEYAASRKASDIEQVVERLKKKYSAAFLIGRIKGNE